MSPSPSTSTSTLLAAARPTRPPSAVMVPVLTTSGPASATVPPGAEIVPSLRTMPRCAGPPAEVSRKLPAMKSALDMSSVEATSPPTSMRAPAPNTTP
jgi:hypothetical protein